MTTVLLLGDQGFLGRHIYRALADEGFAVRVLPARPDGELAGRRPAWWADQLAGADAVVNAAGLTHGEPQALERANVALVVDLVRACHSSRKPLVHLGSQAEYGAYRGKPWAEDDAVAPTSAYGRSKWRGSQAVLDEAHRSSGSTGVLVLRVANPVGSGQPTGTLLGRVAAQLEDLCAGGVAEDPNAMIEVGPLTAQRDLVAATDVGTAAALAIRVLVQGDGAGLRARPRRVINIGSGRATPVRDAVQTLCAAYGFRGRIVEPASGSNRSGTVDVAVARVERAYRLLGWRAATPWQQAVRAIRDGAEVPV